MYFFFSFIFFCDLLFLILEIYSLINCIQARALIRKRKVLLLDEATSALDLIQSLRRSFSSPSTRPSKAAQPSLLRTGTLPSYPFIYISILIFIFILKILTFVQLPERRCPLNKSRQMAPTPSSPNYLRAAHQALVYHTPFTHSTLLAHFNHASSPTTLAASPPHVHSSPTTAPRVSLTRSLAHPLHTKQHASDQGGRAVNEWKPFPSSSRKFTSPLLPSLSVSFPISSSSLPVFYPLFFLY